MPKSSNRIYCFDKLENKSFTTDIKNIAQENWFYGIKDLITDEVEKAIARLERKFFVPFYNDFTALKNFKKIPYNSRKWFFVFLAFQMQRTSLARLGMKNCYKEISIELQKNNLNPDLKKDVDYMLNNIDDPKYIKALHIEMLSPPYDQLFSLAKQFFNKTWVTLLNNNISGLWTSDNPLSFHNSFGSEGNVGIVSDGVEIRFPLTYNTLLYSYDPSTNPPKNNKDKMTREEIELANICQLKSSVRFIFSSEENFDLAIEYLKKYPIYNNPNRNRLKIVTIDNQINLITIE